jgi:hypothetical protein
VTTRTIAWILAAAVAVYLVFTAARSWVLIASGDPVPMLLGVSVIAIPVIGAWVLWRELAFGLDSQRLGRELGSEGGLPVDDLPRSPSGRIQKDAADERFADYEQDVQAAPDDWRAWYRLAIGYDDARDRKRARAAMRRAIALHDARPPAER